MAYTKQNFKDRMTLEAYHLENIEDGILDDVAYSFKGKVISILGDSISTFSGYIPVADGHNLTHRARYPQSNLLTDVALTWWHRLITNLGAKLGVNDSWAGSRVHNSASSNSGDQGPDACMASITRISNLGANGTPDIILFYGGTNDAGGKITIGEFDSTSNYTSVDLTSTTWSSFADAYKTAIMRLQYYYPDTKIISLLPMWTTSYYTIANMDAYGEVVKEICDYFGVPVIDLRKCGINWQNKGYTLGDGIHPTAVGMELMEKYIRRQLFSLFEGDHTEHTVYSVTNNLTNMVNEDRYIKGVSAGESYTATLSGVINNLAVKMGGIDIATDVFDTSTNTITIPSVTGDIIIDESGTVSGTYFTITYNYVNSDGESIQDTTTEVVASGAVKTFSTSNAPYISGYDVTDVSISGEQTITEDLTVTYTYAVSSATWYVDHRNNIDSFTASVNIAGRGWTYLETNPAYEAIVNKPINAAAFFTTKTSQDVAVMKMSAKNATEGTLIAIVTATTSSTTKQLATITFPEVTLAEGEYLALFSADNTDINFYYASASVTDANGIADAGFYSRIPTVYGDGTAWTEFASGCLGWSFGYVV